MNTVQSKDGTGIACRVAGTGPPLILVHGTAADHARWGSVSPALEKQFTIYAVDRRGRGESGDTLPYAIERECEDIAAVIDSAPAPANILGHSHGALCSLEAALLTKNVARIILYEPPLAAGTGTSPPGAVGRIQQLVDAGDREEAVATFFREIVRMPAGEIDKLRALPVWKTRIATAHTIPREMNADDQYRFVPERFRRLEVPTLLLLGGDSPAFMKSATERVHGALPGSHVVVMPGQQHAAMNTAPELFIAEVLRFLTP